MKIMQSSAERIIAIIITCMGWLHPCWKTLCRFLLPIIGVFAWVMIGITSAAALHRSCPAGLAELQPRNGDVFLVSDQFDPIRIRPELDAASVSISTDAKGGLQLYYFVTAPESGTHMLFALLRTISVKGPTSLSPNLVGASNSDNRERSYTRAKYNEFHETKKRGLHPLRKRFHMRFRDTGFRGRNSYDNVDNPYIYTVAPNEGVDVSGYKTRIQRNRGIDPGGRCIRFSMFESANFAERVRHQQTTLIVLNEASDEPTDSLQIEFKFQ